MLKSDHSRVIVHIDIDCFYAQTEEILQPDLRTKNVGIKQKNCIVTCNYNARRFGVDKLMRVSEALEKCPDLVLVNGEDLTKYRLMSDKIFDVLSRFGEPEKLGMDENFVDVTRMLGTRESTLDPETFVEAAEDAECDCGCAERLKVGSQIAREMRSALFTDLGVTSCAGIAYNKQLAKLIGSRHKPNKQTVIFDSAVAGFMRGLETVRKICGIGTKMAELLEGIGVSSVAQLQDVEVSQLRRKLDPKTAEKLKSWAFGSDNTEVKPTGKPKTLSIEDSTFLNPLKNLYEVETKFSTLMAKLLKMTCDDGRTPQILKISLRRPSTSKDMNQRESKQCPIGKSIIANTPESATYLVQVAMSLFKKCVLESNFTITLLGVGVTKFSEEKKGGSSIEKFLSKEAATSVSAPKTVEPTTSPDVKSPPTKKSKLSDFWKATEASTSSNARAEGVPANVDVDIFNSLPDDLKEELKQRWNSPKVAKEKSSKAGKVTLDRFFKPCPS